MNINNNVRFFGLNVMNVENLVGNTPMIKIDYEYEGKQGSIYTKLE